MNVSETTFLLPPTRPDCVARVRIFTPTRELAFAGHPTLGTAWVLAAKGRLPAGAASAALEEGIGPVMVELEGELSRPRFVWMRHRDATFGAERKEPGAPAHGVPEDPATGSASGALGVYAVRHGLVRGDGDVRIVSEQGTKMGRQSFVHIALRASPAAITDIRVGGSVVPALDGYLTLP